VQRLRVRIVVWHHHSRKRCGRGRRWHDSRGGKSKLHRGRSKLLAHVVDGLVGGHWHHRTHRCYHQSKIHGRRWLLPHRRSGGALLMWGRWDATGSRRQDRLVEACHRASYCIHPHCIWVVHWTWVTTRHAVVVVVKVPAMRMAVGPIFKCLEQGGRLRRALAARKSSGLLVRRRGWVTSAAGQRLTQCRVAAVLLLLQRVDAGKELLP
jgi:hypothetical protein